MTPLKSSFLQDIMARGFVHQCTDLEALDEKMAAGPIAAYIGFDATAPSLHVGSLMQIMWLRKLQEHGHKPLILLGTATTRIGDPTWKDEARKMLSDDAIAQNVAGIRKVFGKYLTFGDGPNDAVIVDNSDWLDEMSYMNFLRTFGPHFTINRMMTFDSVKLRLEREQPLTFLEFNYMILQAIDFLHLYRTRGCILQLGGSDQWGNIVNGTDLIRRFESGQGYGLTSPLVTTASGQKMGKTAQGAVWLDEEMLSPFDFWQFWRNTDDADVGRFLKIFTDLPLEEIQKIETLEGADLNQGKILLANYVTHMTHGENALIQVQQAVDGIFGAGGSTAGLPQKTIDPTLAQNDHFSVIDLLIAAGFAASKGEARRLIQGGGARLNDVQVTDIGEMIPCDQLQHAPIKVSAGKKRHVSLSIEGWEFSITVEFSV